MVDDRAVAEWEEATKKLHAYLAERRKRIPAPSKRKRPRGISAEDLARYHVARDAYEAAKAVWDSPDIRRMYHTLAQRRNRAIRAARLSPPTAQASPRPRPTV